MTDGGNEGRDFASELFDNSAVDVAQEDSRDSALSRSSEPIGRSNGDRGGDRDSECSSDFSDEDLKLDIEERVQKGISFRDFMAYFTPV